VVIVVGLTLTAVPLVTEILPGLMTPVPPEKTAVRLELVPVSMVGGAATKLVMMAGTALTVTVVVAVTASPLLGVTVSV
jgi:ABC-type nickel/cobalt efflux system permease component RcnA